VEKAETVPLHFAIKLEILRDQGNLELRKTYMESNMACNLYFFMLYWILHQALSQRGGSITKPGDNGTSKVQNP
jgi:hypothetical protein